MNVKTHVLIVPITAVASIWADRAREKDQALHPRPRLNLFCFSHRAMVTGACPRAFLLEFFTDDPRSVFLQTYIFESSHVYQITNSNIFSLNTNILLTSN